MTQTLTSYITLGLSIILVLIACNEWWANRPKLKVHTEFSSNTLFVYLINYGRFAVIAEGVTVNNYGIQDSPTITVPAGVVKYLGEVLIDRGTLPSEVFVYTNVGRVKGKCLL